ncbi:hypothetical protein OY671_009325, partial [Metschnikowia pulcherrima]
AIAIDEVVAAAGVAKGSFFNHLEDKHDFAGAISRAIRVDVEASVWRTNRDIADPSERSAGGMIAAAAFASAEPKRAAVSTRSSSGTVVEDHPLNRGSSEDMRAASADGLVSPEGGRAGVLYWSGCCQIVMASSVVQRASVDHAAGFVADMSASGSRGSPSTTRAPHGFDGSAAALCASTSGSFVLGSNESAHRAPWPRVTSEWGSAAARSWSSMR